MAEINFATMKGPALVEWFNAHALEAGLKPVSRFASRSKAIKRCEALLNGHVKQKPVIVSGLLETVVGKRKSLKAKLLQHLIDNEGKQVSRKDLSILIYGKVLPALDNVISGLRRALKEKELAYQIKSGRSEKETTFGLHTVK